ncbi:hypothetical protein G5714_006624 [Onychostoma macrolepis]|uniref:Uncharacterized protein n=2 Tax=Onychostoma macrolepis TaxID=369639 RepID=A0A7J6CWU5_9TELE|nr:hypothetical protein G5714_006624 [Onychostoma macrolepis]
MIPCCRSSYCDECECLIKQTSVRSKQAVSDNRLVSGIRTCLLESDGHVCPTCRQSDVSPDSLTANTVLRQDVNHFKNGTRSLHSYLSPNHSHQSLSPIPEPSSKRDMKGYRSCSRSPQNRYGPEETTLLKDFQSCIGETL